MGSPLEGLGSFRSLGLAPATPVVTLQDAADKALFEFVEKVATEEVDDREVVSKAPAGSKSALVLGSARPGWTLDAVVRASTWTSTTSSNGPGGRFVAGRQAARANRGSEAALRRLVSAHGDGARAAGGGSPSTASAWRGADRPAGPGDAAGPTDPACRERQAKLKSQVAVTTGKPKLKGITVRKPTVRQPGRRRRFTTRPRSR